MVDEIGRAKVVVTSQIDKSSIDRTGGKIGAGLKAGALVGVAALGTLAVAGSKAFTAFEEAERQTAKLNQVLDNMGQSAAAPRVDELASSLSKVAGIDDEVIKGGQTLLATFSEVAASAGEVGGTFERATRAAVDLSAAGFGDVSSASVMLGKALQDPVKGITALSRAGVTFTEEQKKLIEGFIAANDVASAQNLILKEVEKQVKGTAEASATEGDKIKTAMGELQETFGLFIDDVISGGKGTKTFSGRLNDLNDELRRLERSDAWKGIAGSIRGIGKAFGFVGSALGAWSNFWYEAGVIARNGVEELNDIMRDVPFIGRFVPDDPRDRDVPNAGLLDPNGNLFLDLPRRGSGGTSSFNGSGVQSVSEATVAPVNNYWQFYGPESLSQARRDEDWSRTYGTRFGSAASAAAR